MKYALALLTVFGSTSAFAAQGITEWDCNQSNNNYTITMNESVSAATIVLDGSTVPAASISTSGSVITVTSAASCPPASLTITVGGVSFGDTPN